MVEIETTLSNGRKLLGKKQASQFPNKIILAKLRSGIASVTVRKMEATYTYRLI